MTRTNQIIPIIFALSIFCIAISVYSYDNGFNAAERKYKINYEDVNEQIKLLKFQHDRDSVLFVTDSTFLKQKHNITLSRHAFND